MDNKVSPRLVTIHKKSKENPNWVWLMAVINRKQIPVCAWCHHDIHAGKYDRMKIANLANKDGVG